MNNPLDFNYAFSSPSGGDLWGPFSIVYFVVVTIGFLVSNYFYYFGKYRYSSNRLSFTIVNRASRNAAIVFSLGFVFFICRLVQLPPFSARIFLDITVILAAYFIIRAISYYFRTYPKARAEWTQLQLRNHRKNDVVATAPVAAPTKAAPLKAAVANSATLVNSSADAGSEESMVIQPATPGALRVRSVRGEKRRERKRNSR